ncbi:hypothetical protein [Clostridium tyrobutyricum]|uniref:hypothetical protein n=1 Tax=Clostridium tyrobutyricum TaxID=1519 RepID=UPI00058089BD|nr:hypothetical protein [Clostridium tyrobutyricum]
MDKYTIYSNKVELNWNAKGNERILQNITNLLNTYTNEVAYNRKMGRNSDNIDRPAPVMIGAVIEETYDLIQEYEPRVNILDVEYMGMEDDIPVLRVVLQLE